MSLNNSHASIQDPTLRALHAEAIRCMEQNLQELLPYYQSVPTQHRKTEADAEIFEAGSLLGFAKTAVRSYAAAITETATPQLKETFQNHLSKYIDLHTKVFQYMLERGLYPAYNLEQLLAGDVRNAKKALSM